MDAFVTWFVGLFSNWGVVWKNFDYLLFGAYPQGPLGGLAMSIIMAVIGIILLIGIAIPTAPGFIGNWHYACIVGLTLFGIPRAEALSFAIIYHFLSIGIILILGHIFLPFNKFSLLELKREAAAGQ